MVRLLLRLTRLVSLLLPLKLGECDLQCVCWSEAEPCYSPDLSWRDVQHLCVRTALQVNPDDPDWETTAAGRPYSYKYGYGSLNGLEFVKAAQLWKTVNPQTWIDLPVVQINNGTMDSYEKATGGETIPPEGIESKITVTQETLDHHNFEQLEHITVKVWITHSRRGDVEVELVSPNGVKSVLAARRNGDGANTGFPGWTFMTVKHWYVFQLCFRLCFHTANDEHIGTRVRSAIGRFVSRTNARRTTPESSSDGR